MTETGFLAPALLICSMISLCILLVAVAGVLRNGMQREEDNQD